MLGHFNHGFQFSSVNKYVTLLHTQTPQLKQKLRTLLVSIKVDKDHVITSLSNVFDGATGGNQSPQWNNFPSTLLVSEDAPVGKYQTKTL